jgi:hypothetical protein
VKTKELQIGVSRTFNLGNFESLRVEAAMTASIDEGDDHDEVRLKILDEIRKSLSAAYKANHPGRNGQ